MEDKIKRMLGHFIDEMGAGKYYATIASGNGYKWGFIYEKRSHDSVIMFRGRTYGDLLENIRLAYAAHRTTNLNS